MDIAVPSSALLPLQPSRGRNLVGLLPKEQLGQGERIFAAPAVPPEFQDLFQGDSIDLGCVLHRCANRLKVRRGLGLASRSFPRGALAVEASAIEIDTQLALLHASN
jgi:hypothetical protein